MSWINPKRRKTDLPSGARGNGDAMMAGSTNIEWTDCTWNPTVGCTVCAAGCRNCYAMRMAARLEAIGVPHYAGTTRKVNGKAVWTGKIAVAPDGILIQPLLWRKPRRIFVNSMSDLFHEEVPDAVIDRVFAVMALCPQHTFQVLTKRTARMREYVTERRGMMGNIGGSAISVMEAHTTKISGGITTIFPLENSKARDTALDALCDGLPNVWLGTSVSTQADADANIPDLLATQAAVRFVSVEPMLGPVNLGRCLDGLLDNLDWVICGGESGPGSRPMHPDWARSLRDQCKAAGVPFFFKQWGEWAPADDWASEIQEDHDVRGLTGDGVIRVGKKRAGALLDGREHREWPASPQRTNGGNE